MLHRNTWNHLTVYKRALPRLKMLSTNYSFANIRLMYKQDLTLDNFQGLICHKTNQPTNQLYFFHHNSGCFYNINCIKSNEILKFY